MNSGYLSNPSNELSLDLWERAQDDDWNAFGELAELHYRLLFNYATNFTGDHDLIRDIIQDLYLHLWEERKSIKMQQVAFYMLRAVRNKIFNSFRDKKSRAAALQEYFENESDFTESNIELISNEIELSKATKLTEAIEALPKRQKEVIFLKYYQGMDNEQIALLLNVNRQSIANLAYKALNNLRQQIPENYWILVVTPLFKL